MGCKTPHSQSLCLQEPLPPPRLGVFLLSRPFLKVCFFFRALKGAATTLKPATSMPKVDNQHLQNMTPGGYQSLLALCARYETHAQPRERAGAASSTEMAMSDRWWEV